MALVQGKAIRAGVRTICSLVRRGLCGHIRCDTLQVLAYRSQRNVIRPGIIVNNVNNTDSALSLGV